MINVDYVTDDLTTSEIADYLDSVTDNSLKIYLKDIGRIPLLSEDEEKDLCYRLANGDESARSKLIESNLRLVVSTIRKRYNTKDESTFLDLIQYGNEGLIKAIDNFDLTKGCKVSTHATWCILREISRGKGRLKGIPPHVLEPLNKIKKFEISYEAKNGRTPKTSETASVLKLTEENVELYKLMDEPIISLETSVIDDDVKLKDCIIGEDLISEIYDNLYYEDIKKLIAKILTKKQLEVISLRYGFEDNSIKTLEEVAKLVHITKEGVRKIELKSFKIIRGYLSQKDKSENRTKKLR